MKVVGDKDMRVFLRGIQVARCGGVTRCALDFKTYAPLITRAALIESIIRGFPECIVSTKKGKGGAG